MLYLSHGDHQRWESDGPTTQERLNARTAAKNWDVPSEGWTSCLFPSPTTIRSNMTHASLMDFDYMPEPSCPSYVTLMFDRCDDEEEVQNLIGVYQGLDMMWGMSRKHIIKFHLAADTGPTELTRFVLQEYARCRRDSYYVEWFKVKFLA